MNSLSPFHKITTYQDLLDERARLEEVIKGQKFRVRKDLDDLKLEAQQELKPVFEAAHFIKMLTTRETRNNTLISIGTNVTLDLLIRRLFAKSNILLQIFVPTLIKNYSTHVLFNIMRKIEQRRQNGKAHLSNTIR